MSMIKPNLERYQRGVVEVELSSGVKQKVTVHDVADNTALELRKMTLEEIYIHTADKCKEAGLESIGPKKIAPTAEGLNAAYNHLNKGQQRMALGNILRGLERRKAKEAA
jgi:hypothetical protein